MHRYTGSGYKFGYIRTAKEVPILGLTDEKKPVLRSDSPLVIRSAYPKIAVRAGDRKGTRLLYTVQGYILICIHSLFLYLWSFPRRDATLGTEDYRNKEKGK